MEKIDPRWLAGVLDAKGLPLYGRTTKPFIDLRLPSNNRKLLEAFQRGYEGTINDRKSGTHQYSLGSMIRLSYLLRDVDPYLEFKRDKLALAREFLQVARFYPPANKERMRLWRELRALDG